MKKKVIIYGNCHAALIAKYLRTNINFNKMYTIIPIKPIQNIVKDETYIDSIKFEQCDVFIHQSIQLNNRYGIQYSSQNIIKRLKKGCRVIAIPNVYHLPMYMFPQYYEENEFKIKKHTLFFRDRLLDEVFESGGNEAAAKEEYLNENFYDIESIETLWDSFICKIMDREKEWDIKLSSYLKKNKAKILFFDPNHPNNTFFEYVIAELMKMLDVEIGNINIKSRLDSYEMPVHKSVLKALGIDDFDIQIIRCSGKKLCIKKMDIDEYIREYYYCWLRNKDNKKIDAFKYIKNITNYLINKASTEVILSIRIFIVENIISLIFK